MRLLLFLVALTVTSGCASGSRVTTGGAHALNAAAEGRRVVVVLHDGSEARAGSLRADTDSTSWIDPETGALRVVPTSLVREVRRKDRGRSTRRGAGGGAIVGALLGGSLGAVVGYDLAGFCLFGCTPPTAGERAVGALGGAVAGGSLGAAYGAVVGLVVGVLAVPDDRILLDPASASETSDVDTASTSPPETNRARE